MITVVAIDALEYNLVEEFDLSNLKLSYYGKTDISEFSQPRTMVLWSSFMTGENKEREVLADGDKEMWGKRWDIGDTLFSRFSNPAVLDLPGFSYDTDVHDRSRELLKAYFDTDDEDEKKNIRSVYNGDAFEHHKYVREEFTKAIEGDHDFVLGYFSLADVVGHLNFGNKTMMKMIYKEMDEIVSNVGGKVIVLSDHGMKAIGYFGDHSEYGFWSTNFRDMGTPRITDFRTFIESEGN
jgi:hypothetical protein